MERLDETSYWRRRRTGSLPVRRLIGRRSVLRGGGLGLAGLAGAALIGCEDDEEPVVETPAATPPPAAPTRSPARNEARIYDGPIPATAAEMNPAANARRGGTLRMRYLEPPHLDINRTLSCTTYHPLS